MALEELVVGPGFLVVFGAQPHVIGNSYRVRDVGGGMQGASFLAPRDLALSRLGHSSLLPSLCRHFRDRAARGFEPPTGRLDAVYDEPEWCWSCRADQQGWQDSNPRPTVLETEGHHPRVIERDASRIDRRYRRRAANARQVPRRGLCCTIDATPIRNAIPKITTGHQVPVIPEIAQNTVRTPSTAVIHFRRCHVMPSSFRVGEMTLGSSAIRLCSFRLTRGRLSTPPGRQQPHGRGAG